MSSQPREREMDAELFGRPIRFSYSETWIAYSVLSLRFVMGYVFLSAGIQKLLDPTWTARQYLVGAVPAGNPLRPVFTAMADGWLWLIDPLNVYGQILIGLAVLFGAFLRLAVFFGALMMLLFWLTQFQAGPLAGLPVTNGYVVTYHLVYALILFGLGAVGAGRILGIDDALEDTTVVRENPWIRYVLG